MRRQFPTVAVVLSSLLLAATAGCRPQQPFYLFEDGDLSHYIGVATQIDYADLQMPSLDEVEGALPPLTLENPDPEEIWELTLEEAVRYALANSKVIRLLDPQLGPNQSLLSQPQFAPTIYQPALQESDPRFGVEAALAAFDAQFISSVFWEKNDTPQNIGAAVTFFRPSVFEQDLGTFQAQLRKTAATGGTWSLTHNVRYEWNNSNEGAGPFGSSRRFESDWNVNLEAEFRQPFLQGNGVQFNRIAGPGSIPGFNNGVMIARINTDTSLADFEASVRNLVSDVERAYWELYFAYHRLDALKEGRDRALDTWRKVQAEFETGKAAAQDEALARHQYFLLRREVELSLSELYRAENALRYIMGLTTTDGRLIRPADEPTTARVEFDWYETHAESLARSAELRRQKWVIKRRELELVAAKNYLLPRLDAVGRYRWLGLGDRLIDSDDVISNAYGDMTSGNFQEWQLGLELSIPIGFRKEMAGVRNAQLALARERAVLQEQELQVSHLLAQAIRELDQDYDQMETNFNLLVAAEAELDAYEATEAAGIAVRTLALDRILDAQNRVTQAQIAYYTSMRDYNLAITQIHFRKGSLLEYNGVYLTEGPWPGKAYFDAHRLARARDASMYLDYGFTRPKVISRGRYDQHAGRKVAPMAPEPAEGADVPTEGPEVIPTPDPWPMEESGSAAVEPEADRSTAQSQVQGPRLTAAHPEHADAASGRGSKGVDLGQLDLDRLSDSNGSRSGASARKSPVQPAGYQRPVPAGGSERTEQISSGWKSARRAPDRHESSPNRTSAEADRSASGWKRVQH